MATRYTCPCGKRMKIPDELLAKPLKCPKCNRKVVVSKPEAQAPQKQKVGAAVEAVEAEPVGSMEADDFAGAENLFVEEEAAKEEAPLKPNRPVEARPRGSRTEALRRGRGKDGEPAEGLAPPPANPLGKLAWLLAFLVFAGSAAYVTLLWVQPETLDDLAKKIGDLGADQGKLVVSIVVGGAGLLLFLLLALLGSVAGGVARTQKSLLGVMQALGELRREVKGGGGVD